MPSADAVWCVCTKTDLTTLLKNMGRYSDRVVGMGLDLGNYSMSLRLI